MGQRHQVYVNLKPVYYNPDNPNNRGPKVVGFHHQWLYGWTATRFLKRALDYIAICNKQEYGPFSHTAHDALPALAALYSVEESTGYFHTVQKFDDKDGEVKNPHLGDNNDGITVIDLTGDAPAYCFYSLGSTEGTKSLREGCYSARQYLESYYPKFKGHNGEDLSGDFKPVLMALAKVRVLTPADMKRIFPAMKPIRNVA